MQILNTVPQGSFYYMARVVSDEVSRQHEIDEEQRAWDMYMGLFPNMTKESFVPYSEFKKKLYTPQQEGPSDEEIRAKTLKVINFNRGGEG